MQRLEPVLKSHCVLSSTQTSCPKHTCQDQAMWACAHPHALPELRPPLHVLCRCQLWQHCMLSLSNPVVALVRSECGSTADMQVRTPDEIMRVSCTSDCQANPTAGLNRGNRQSCQHNPSLPLATHACTAAHDTL